jgi:hypothetical protein
MLRYASASWWADLLGRRPESVYHRPWILITILAHWPLQMTSSGHTAGARPTTRVRTRAAAGLSIRSAWEIGSAPSQRRDSKWEWTLRVTLCCAVLESGSPGCCFFPHESTAFCSCWQVLRCPVRELPLLQRACCRQGHRPLNLVSVYKVRQASMTMPPF